MFGGNKESAARQTQRSDVHKIGGSALADRAASFGNVLSAVKDRAPENSGTRTRRLSNEGTSLFGFGVSNE
jgi:hypothetical protein